ncbi:MAG: ankyrin repeat domain-containing protein [Candidatus Cardinium sp.]|uniref:ankyrin repeat domain-containing protein n=1 Tax=Cardinium endosymbiont of Dermatophagoides farinae TaxID=2597823 RepID=UPI001642E922|nr:ankyrin repeat domain-containing protein [Cardinium endosymbiont of Dermatophagoides farinae]UWW97292.1 MAG: ankyrin repeat domain-containing protein [Candidatus Cardinium sp.]
MGAVGYNNEPAVEFVLTRAPEVDLKDSNGQTALIMAVHGDIDERIVKHLLDHDADPCIKDKSQNTARFYAEEENNKKPSEKVSSVIAMLDTAIAERYPKTKKCPEA